MRLLVVDDEPALRAALGRALRSTATSSTRPRTATPRWSGSRSDRPTRSILDVLMPGRRRPRGLPAPARRRRPDADPDADRPRRRRRPRRRPRRGRRRLPAEAVRAGRAAGPPARAAAPRRHRVGPARCCASPTWSSTPARYEARRGDRLIELTRTEFALLELLLRNARRVLPRDVIFERVWGSTYAPLSNSLEVYVGYLRRKTEAAGEPRLSRPCAASATCCGSDGEAPGGDRQRPGGGDRGAAGLADRLRAGARRHVQRDRPDAARARRLAGRRAVRRAAARRAGRAGPLGVVRPGGPPGVAVPVGAAGGAEEIRTDAR